MTTAAPVDITADVLAAQHHCPRCGWRVWLAFYLVGRGRIWRCRDCHRASVAARPRRGGRGRCGRASRP